MILSVGDSSWRAPRHQAALLAAQAAQAGVPSAQEEGWPKLPPVKIYKLYAGRTGDDYLTRPTEELGRFEKYFNDLEVKLGDVKFVGGDMVPPANVDEVASKLKAADGLMIIHLSHHGGDAPMLSKLIDVGLPTALFSQPFSGHGWMYFPQWHKQGKKVVLFPSSDWSEQDRAAGLLRSRPHEAHADPLRGWTPWHLRRLLGQPCPQQAGCRADHHLQRHGHGSLQGG